MSDSTSHEADVRSGGRPEDAPDPRQGLAGYSMPSRSGDGDSDELLGTPGDDEREPSQADGSSGQDAGSMD